MGASVIEGLKPDGFVTDAADLLSPTEEAAFEADLEVYRRETTNELAVVTLPSLEGRPLEDVALEIGRRWGVGTREKNNGIVLLIALEERAVRLEVGYGLEGAVPDIAAKRIIDEAILPRFREGRFADGIRDGIAALKAAIGGEYIAPSVAEPREDLGKVVGPFLVLFFFAFQFLVHLFRRTKSWWLGGVLGAGLGGLFWGVFHWFWIVIPAFTLAFLVLDFFLSKYPPARTGGPGGFWLGRGGFGGRSGSGGGFGGGSFGGGGSSGRW